MRKRKEGIVVAAKTPKTIKVLVEKVYQHPLYKKVVKSYKNFLVHDEENQCRVGDRVIIGETRPISRLKHFRVVEVLGKARVKTRELPAKMKKEEPSDTAAQPAEGSR